MDKKRPHAVRSEPKVKDIMRHLLMELGVLPKDEERADLLKQQENDTQVLQEKFKALELPSSALDINDHLKNLGFGGGIETYMCTRDRSVIFSDKCLYGLGRSWFKEEGFTKNDKCASLYMMKKDKEIDDDAKKYLQEFVEKAKAAKALARMARKKGKKRFYYYAYRREEKKSVPKM